jgi:hypothetical protein
MNPKDWIWYRGELEIRPPNPWRQGGMLMAFQPGWVVIVELELSNPSSRQLIWIPTERLASISTRIFPEPVPIKDSWGTLIFGGDT